MSEKQEEVEPVTVFVCGPKDCEHVWDGPGVEWETGGSATCSKCGMSAIEHSLWNGP